MHIVNLENHNVIAAAREAARHLTSGGVILYPTDTLYGLGVDALSDEAVEKIYAIKGRDMGKPIHCVVADMAMAERYVYVNEAALTLAKHFLPGPLTLILKKKDGIETGIAKGIATIGIRIPNNASCVALAREFDGPITATSANISGEEPRRSIRAILEQLSKPYTSVLQNTCIEYIELAIDVGELPPSAPSTVVDLTGPTPIVLREGAIRTEELQKYLAF